MADIRWYYELVHPQFPPVSLWLVTDIFCAHAVLQVKWMFQLQIPGLAPVGPGSTLDMSRTMHLTPQYSINNPEMAGKAVSIQNPTHTTWQEIETLFKHSECKWLYLKREKHNANPTSDSINGFAFHLLMSCSSSFISWLTPKLYIIICIYI